MPTFCSEKVADAVLELKGDKKLRESMGENAKSLVEEKFLFSKTIDDMERVYKSLAL